MIRATWRCSECHQFFPNQQAFCRHQLSFPLASCISSRTATIRTRRPVAVAPRPAAQSPETTRDFDDFWREKARKHDKLGVDFMSMVALLNNGRGMSEKDIAHLLDFITRIKTTGEDLPFKNSSQYTDFCDKVMMDVEDGCVSCARLFFFISFLTNELPPQMQVEECQHKCLT